MHYSKEMAFKTVLGRLKIIWFLEPSKMNFIALKRYNHTQLPSFGKLTSGVCVCYTEELTLLLGQLKKVPHVSSFKHIKFILGIQM